MRPWTDAEIAEYHRRMNRGMAECQRILGSPKTTSRKETFTMNAIQKWEMKIEEFQKRGMTMAQATRETVVQCPDIHKEYLREYNAMHGRTI